MSKNPNEEDRLCRAAIDNKLSKLIKGKIPFIVYKDLVRECLITYAVSRGSIETFIQDFYIETKDLLLDNGSLKPNNEVRQ
jgi:hypothetical protein